MFESILTTNTIMRYIEQILIEEHLQRDLLNDFTIYIDSETGWSRDDFNVKIIFRDGPCCSFPVYRMMGNLEEQLINELRTAIITLTRHIPKLHQEQQTEQLYFASRKRVKILNSRFRPDTYLKPTWERYI